MRFALLAALTLASSALGDDVLYAPEGPIGVSLLRHELAEAPDTDVRVSRHLMWCAHGVRLEAGGPVVRELPLASGEVYAARDARGLEHRLRVDVDQSGTLRVVLFDLGTGQGPTPGDFEQARVTVNGDHTDAKFGALSLRPDGTYRVGTLKGRWRVGRGQVLLSGPFEHWGPGEVVPTGALRFQWVRGPLTFSVEYQPRPAVAVK